MNQQDRIFDGLAERFGHRIYGNTKGDIRLAVVQEDIQKHIELKPSMSVLDMGAGLGQMSIWLAKQGHQVDLVEPSADMLASAQQLIAEEGIDKQIHCQQQTAQAFIEQTDQQYDLIVFHAVMEWLAYPKQVLQSLLTLLKPHGHLSVLFYNQHSAVMRSLLVGDFQRIENDQIAAMGNKGFTPISPLDPEHVKSWLEQEWGLDLLCWSGVRCFYDYMRPEARTHCDAHEDKRQNLIEMEKRYSKKEPWRSMARYQHMIIRKDY